MILALLIDRVDLSGRVGLSGRGSVEVAGTKTATDRSLRLQAADQRFGPYWLAPRCVENAGRGITDCSCDREPLIPRLPDNNEKKFSDECRFLHLPSLGGRLLILSFLPSNHLLSQPGMTFLSLVLCHQFDSILIMYLCHELNYMYVDITKLV